MMRLVGHADRRSFSGNKTLYYGTNETLAYQRALEVKKALLATYSPITEKQPRTSEFSQKMIIVEGGPVSVERSSLPEQLAQDRSVEIFSFGIDDAASSRLHPH